MPTAYSYHRFSHPSQMSKEKLWRQLEQARDYAGRHNLTLDEQVSFQDLGVSAFHGANRSIGRLGEFLRAVQTGFIERDSYLLVESLDRLSRDTARKALRTLEDICDEGITVVTLIDNQTYTSALLDEDPSSLLFSLVIFLRANEESVTKSRRVTAAWKAKIERARKGESVILTKQTPSWIKIEDGKFVVDREQAQIVKKIFKWAELGLGGCIIAKVLNRNNIPTLRSARYWRAGYVNIILRSPSVNGTYLPYFYEKIDGKRVRTPYEGIPNYYPKIVSNKTWTAVQKHLDQRSGGPHYKKGKNPYAASRNLFGWISRCPRCGSSMSIKGVKPSEIPASGTRRHLVCTYADNSDCCTCEPVPYDPLEKAFRAEGPAMMARHINDLKSGDSSSAGKLDAPEIKLVESRTESLKSAIQNENFDRKQLNRLIRNLFASVIINYLTKELEFNWRFGGRTTLSW